jgi:hypothetical protein
MNNGDFPEVAGNALVSCWAMLSSQAATWWWYASALSRLQRSSACALWKNWVTAWGSGEVQRKVPSLMDSSYIYIIYIYNLYIYICLIFNMVYFYFMVKVWWPNMCWSCDWIWIWLNTIQYHQISGSKCVWHPKFPGRSPKEGSLPLANLFNRDHPKDGGQIHFKWF